MNKEGDLRIWWVPQVPMNAFYVYVDSIKEAIKVYNILADYDYFQFENNVKGDYANAGGLQVFEDGEWLDWLDENGEDFDYMIVNLL